MAKPTIRDGEGNGTASEQVDEIDRDGVLVWNEDLRFVGQKYIVIRSIEPGFAANHELAIQLPQP